MADAGLYLLQPAWKHNPAFVTSGVNGGGNVTSSQQDFDYSLQLAPRFHLGWTNSSGFGVRAGWWGMAVSSSTNATDASLTGLIASAAPLDEAIFSTGTAAAPTQLFFTSKLRMEIWDLEATQSFPMGPWTFMAAGGARYAHLSQGYSATEVNAAGAVVQAVDSGHSFTGVGPTVALGASRQLGNSNLFVFSSARGSLLFGSSKSSALFTNIAGFTSTDSTHSPNDVLPEGEIEIGVGYSRNVGRSSQFFVQAGVIGQVWFEAGNASRNNNADVLGGNQGGTVSDPNLSLIGFSLRTGFNF